MENYWGEPIKVRHKSLKRSSDESMFRSVCPVCEKGRLMMRRNISNGMTLQKDDNCTLCGTRFEYTDIEEDILLKYKEDEKEESVWEEFFPLIAAVIFCAIIAFVHYS